MPEQINSRLGQVDVTARDNAPTEDSAQGHSLSHFLRLLFRLLDEFQIRYCVLHSWERLPDELPSDLDIAIHPRDRAKLAFVFQGLLDEGYRPIQNRHYAARAHRFDFVWFEQQGMRSAGIDVAEDYREHGMILWRGQELVLGRRQFNGFWVADPTTEFAYTLAKNALKGTLLPHQVERFRVLENELGKPQAQKIAGELFGTRWKDQVVDACASGTLSSLLGQLKKQLWLTKLRKDLLNPVRYLLMDIPRLIGRVFEPTGVFLVMLGPDGVGKSTLVGTLAQSLEDAAFTRFRLFHWRPMMILPKEETGAPVTDPHDQHPRGTLGSIVALSFIFLDYLLGYVFLIRPFLARAGLIIFDRYYHDLLIDPIRYRYGGPMWVAKFLGRFIPPPDLLFLVLDAEEDVILSRKNELAPQELRRQREGYHQFTFDTKSAALVKTDRGVERTVREANQFVVDYMARRFERRHARWLAAVR